MLLQISTVFQSLTLQFVTSSKSCPWRIVSWCVQWPGDERGLDSCTAGTPPVTVFSGLPTDKRLLLPEAQRNHRHRATYTTCLFWAFRGITRMWIQAPAGTSGAVETNSLGSQYNVGTYQQSPCGTQAPFSLLATKNVTVCLAGGGGGLHCDFLPCLVPELSFLSPNSRPKG